MEIHYNFAVYSFRRIPRGTESLRYLGLRETKDFAKRKYAAEPRQSGEPCYRRRSALNAQLIIYQRPTHLPRRAKYRNAGALAIVVNASRGQKMVQGGERRQQRETF